MARDPSEIVTVLVDNSQIGEPDKTYVRYGTMFLRVPVGAALDHLVREEDRGRLPCICPNPVFLVRNGRRRRITSPNTVLQAGDTLIVSDP